MSAMLLGDQVFQKETLCVSGFVVSQNLTGLWHCDITKRMAQHVLLEDWNRQVLISQ